MTKLLATVIFSALLLVTGSVSAAKQKQPDILWIITDDQRPDSISAFNQAVSGTKLSPLGYVQSPHVDKLAAEGTLFSQAYCNSPACAPSRGSMHTGRYPFRSGIYGFERAHPNVDTNTQTIPQVMRGAGYHTAQFGKHGYRIFRWGPGNTWDVVDQYDFRVDKKNDLTAKGRSDFHVEEIWQKDRDRGRVEVYYYPDGTTTEFYINRQDAELTDEDIKARKNADKKHDVLRAYTRGQNMLIIGGESTQPADKTQDGEITNAFVDYLKKNADDPKPLFANLGYHFPHTPVLPPKSFREAFMEKEVEIPYRIPEFDLAEVEKLPPQMKKFFDYLNFSEMTEDEKRQAIRDYYAFCAHGDAQIGRSIEAFKEFCKKRDRDWIIVFVCGDHSWHLGEQGIEAKFTPWGLSTRNAIVAASSIKGMFPKGAHSEQLVEYVDLAPTFFEAAGVDVGSDNFSHLDGASLMRTVRGTARREYILGEINAIAGPRAYMRTKDFAFSMRTRPENGKPGPAYAPGENIDWALTCPRDKAELALYDLRVDPDERNNVANDPEYKALADWFRKKLGDIVLGDRRLEVDWTKENEYYLSDFAVGADDKKLRIPKKLIPKQG
ncbi:MAG: sulfatase-like hydrolase/transferase [Verrucomicrobiota bacterium]